MKKKIFIILICGVMLLGIAGCGQKTKTENEITNNEANNEQNVNYEYGDKVSIKLNDNETEIGNIIKVDGSKVEVLLQTISTNLEYDDLESHMAAKKESWENAEKVALLSVEHFFEKCDTTLNHIMDGYSCNLKEEDLFLFASSPYWLSGSDAHDANCYYGDGDISNCSWYTQGQEIALTDIFYTETGFRPVVTINIKYVSKEIQSNNDYELYDEVILKNDSKWIVLEDLGDEVLLIKTKKNALVENTRINSIISEEDEQLKESLRNLNQDVSGLKMRIPTSKDLEKYFNFDFSKEEDGRVYGKTLDSSTQNVTKDWEYSSFWVKKDNDYISCKTSNGQMYCSMDEIELETKWHVLIILQIKKSNIK